MTTPAPAEVPQSNPEAARCDFYLKHKRRFCKSEKRPSHTLCPSHAAEVDGDPNAKRVPCPINPNHSVYERDLKRHVAVCPDRRFDPSALPYYSLDLHANRWAKQCKVCDDDEDPEEGGNEAPRAEGEHPPVRLTHRDLAPDARAQLIAKVCAIYKKRVEPMIRTLANPELVAVTPVVPPSAQCYSQKHGPQHDALIRLILEGSNGLAGVGAVVEMGAGKGGLAYALGVALPDATVRPKVFVIDFGGRRMGECSTRRERPSRGCDSTSRI